MFPDSLDVKLQRHVVLVKQVKGSERTCDRITLVSGI